MLTTLALAVLLPAAPVPKVADAELRKAFGPFADTDDATATFANGRLTLASKGKARRNFFDDGKLVGYRTEREATGDFTLEVTLLTTARPKQDNPMHDARVLSGVYVRHGTEVLMVGKFVRTATHENKAIHDESLWLQHDGSGTRLDGGAHDETAEVRLVRTGPAVEVFLRTGNRDWRKYATTKTRFTGDVTVGVCLLPEVDQPTEAAFTGFKLKAK